MDFGSQGKEKNLIKAFTMPIVIIFRNGIASGKRVDEHMIVNRY